MWNKIDFFTLVLLEIKVVDSFILNVDVDVDESWHHSFPFYSENWWWKMGQRKKEKKRTLILLQSRLYNNTMETISVHNLNTIFICTLIVVFNDDYKERRTLFDVMKYWFFLYFSSVCCGLLYTLTPVNSQTLNINIYLASCSTS